MKRRTSMLAALGVVSMAGSGAIGTAIQSHNDQLHCGSGYTATKYGEVDDLGQVHRWTECDATDPRHQVAIPMNTTQPAVYLAQATTPSRAQAVRVICIHGPRGPWLGGFCEGLNDQPYRSHNWWLAEQGLHAQATWSAQQIIDLARLVLVHPAQ